MTQALNRIAMQTESILRLRLSIRIWFAAAGMILGLLGCANQPGVPPTAVADLAPTGKLRVGLILANPVLVSKDSASGELRGVAIDLGKDLAARLGVPFEPVGYPTVAKLVDSANSNEWDVAFLAFDPARASDMEFSAPYMEVDNTYLLPAGSKIKSLDDIDQPGIRIAVPEKSAPDLFLSRTLKNATLVRGKGGAAAALDILKSGQADAFAENRQLLTTASAKLPGSRVLDGRFSAVQHAVAVTKGRLEGVAYVRGYLEEAKASGLVQQAINQAGLIGVNVAQAAR